MIEIREERNREPAPFNADAEANARATAERCLTQISNAFQEAGWGAVDELKVTFPRISTDIAYVINWKRDR